MVLGGLGGSRGVLEGSGGVLGGPMGVCYTPIRQSCMAPDFVPNTT